MHIKRFIFKQLAHMMMEVRGSKSTGWTSMLETQKRADIAADIPRYYRSSPQASAAQIPLVHGERVFCSSPGLQLIG